MKLGISYGYPVKEYSWEDIFELLKRSGFDSVNLSLGRYGTQNDEQNIYYASDDEFCTYFDNIRKKAEEWEIEITQTHGRCLTYTPDEEYCEKVKYITERDLKATKVLGAPACVIHSIISGKWADHYMDADFMFAKNNEMFNDFIPFAEKYGVKLGIETFGRAKINGESKVDFFADANIFKKQFDMIETDMKTVCFDTGHTHEAVAFGVPSVQDAIRIIGKDITLLHLHDNNGASDQHLIPLGSGAKSIQWGEVFDALDDIGYGGAYTFELDYLDYGRVFADAIKFYGKYLRYFLDNKGRLPRDW